MDPQAKTLENPILEVLNQFMVQNDQRMVGWNDLWLKPYLLATPTLIVNPQLTATSHHPSNCEAAWQKRHSNDENVTVGSKSAEAYLKIHANPT